MCGFTNFGKRLSPNTRDGLKKCKYLHRHTVQYTLGAEELTEHLKDWILR